MQIEKFGAVMNLAVSEFRFEWSGWMETGGRGGCSKGADEDDDANENWHEDEGIVDNNDPDDEAAAGAAAAGAGGAAADDDGGDDDDDGRRDDDDEDVTDVDNSVDENETDDGDNDTHADDDLRWQIESRTRLWIAWPWRFPATRTGLNWKGHRISAKNPRTHTKAQQMLAS